MAVLLANNATSKLASSLTTGATTLAVTTGEGSKFPSPTGGDWFPLTLIKSSGALEILRCTARSGDVLTVTRAQEGTAAQAFSAGDRVEVRLTKAVIDAIVQQINDLTNSALLDANNLSDLENAATARGNLGLGTAATKNAQTSPTDTSVGALMAVGAFGLGAKNALANTSSNADDMHTAGWVWLNSVASGKPPGTTSGLLFTQPAVSNTTNAQFFFEAVVAGSPALFWRQKNASTGAWREWIKLFHTGNISAFIQTLFDDADAAAARATLGITVADGGLGYGQTWQNVIASRAQGTTYTNTTGRPIQVSIKASQGAGGKGYCYVNGLAVAELIAISATDFMYASFIVPNGATYSYTVTAGVQTTNIWAELR